MCEDGLMLDMSSMKRISVDSEHQLAVAQALAPRAAQPRGKLTGHRMAARPCAEAGHLVMN